MRKAASVLDERVRVPDAKDVADSVKSLRQTLAAKTRELAQCRAKLIQAESRIYENLSENGNNKTEALEIRRAILQKRVDLQEKISLLDQMESEIASTKISDLHKLRDRFFTEAAGCRRDLAMQPDAAELQNEALNFRKLRDERDALESEILLRKRLIAQLKPKLKIERKFLNLVFVDPDIPAKAGNLSSDLQRLLRRFAKFPGLLRLLASVDHDKDGRVSVLQLHAKFPALAALADLQRLADAISDGNHFRLLDLFLAAKLASQASRDVDSEAIVRKISDLASARNINLETMRGRDLRRFLRVELEISDPDPVLEAIEELGLETFIASAEINR